MANPNPVKVKANPNPVMGNPGQSTQGANSTEGSIGGGAGTVAPADQDYSGTF